MYTNYTISTLGIGGTKGAVNMNNIGKELCLKRVMSFLSFKF